MAESMCGPSNAANKLVNVADRDRTRHQDRVRSSPANQISSFRSSPCHFGNASEAFASFQNGNNTIPTFLPSMPAAHHFPGVMPGVRYLSYAAPLSKMGDAINRAGTPGSLVYNEHSSSWVFEFSNLNISSATRLAGIAGPSVQKHLSGPAPTQSLMDRGFPPHEALPHFPMQQPAFSSFAQPENMMPRSRFQLNHAGIASAHTVPCNMTDKAQFSNAAFDAAFDAVSGSLMDQEFETDMDNWMREHGPSATAQNLQYEASDAIEEQLEDLARELEQRRADGDPAVLSQSEKQDNMNMGVEWVFPDSKEVVFSAVPEEQEHAINNSPSEVSGDFGDGTQKKLTESWRRKQEELEGERQKIEKEAQKKPESQGKSTEQMQMPEDVEMAKAAQQILTSVSDNTTDKFKNSQFLSLMRLIANGQVIVKGDDLVSTESTETAPEIMASG